MPESQSVSSKIDELIRKLEILKKRDASLKLFGSSDHRYLLNRPLTENDIADFEEKHRITLPDDYRLFLQRVGNGGAGPCYGLIKLENTLDHATLENGAFSLEDPFPHQEEWNLIDTYQYEEEWYLTDKYKFGDNPNQVALNKFETEYFQNKHINGSLGICHEGCGYYDLLVVSGKEKGHVWTDSRVSDGGIRPIKFQYLHISLASLHNKEERVSFISWYESWLNDALEKIK